jgi:hypothetical protein
MRDFETDILQFSLTHFGIYDAVVPLLARSLERTGSTEITDMCSGAGGPWKRLQPLLSRHLQRDIRVTLTDLRPNLPAIKRLAAASGGSIRFYRESVDVTSAGPSARVRTLFTAFHHFPPDIAHRILTDARDNHAAICIFEYNSRSVMAFLSALTAPLIILAGTPFMRPVCLSRFLLTYFLPVIPLNILYNGAASSLRTYSMPELRKLTANLRSRDYEWECGVIPMGLLPQITYLLGLPR